MAIYYQNIQIPLLYLCFIIHDFADSIHVLPFVIILLCTELVSENCNLGLHTMILQKDAVPPVLHNFLLKHYFITMIYTYLLKEVV